MDMALQSLNLMEIVMIWWSIWNPHELCSDDDVIEVLNTNLHCTIDDEQIIKSDSLRRESKKIFCKLIISDKYDK